MPVIAVASKKGGSGKTTISTNLADALDLAGERVLLLDADPQRSSLLWPQNAEDASNTPPVLGVDATMGARGRIPALRLSYDWVLIDCPPRHGEILTAALAVADLVLVPVRPSSMDLVVLASTVEAIAAARESHPLAALAVLNQRPSRSSAADEMPAILTAAGLPVAATQLGFRADYTDAYTRGTGVCRAAPKSKAAAEIQALLAEIRAILSPTPTPAPKAKNKRGKR